MKDIKMMSKGEMINYFDELYMNLTDDPKEAIYMFPNGLIVVQEVRITAALRK